jgi:hypothetical protein
MWNVLKSNSTASSTRLMMIWIAFWVGMILGAVVFHIIWITVVPLSTTVVIDPISHHGYVTTRTYAEIPWLALTAFISGTLSALLTLWYGKKMNKSEEIKQGTKESDTPITQ